MQSTDDWKDFELDANARDNFDDGLPGFGYGLITVNNPAQTVRFEVTNLVQDNDIIVNILLDLNADGDWDDVVDGQSEHVVQNQQLNLVGPAEGVFTSIPFSTAGAAPGMTWMRITLTRSQVNSGWNGTIASAGYMDPFECDETEDWAISMDAEGALEFGHALDPTYQSNLSSDGARHIQY